MLFTKKTNNEGENQIVRGKIQLQFQVHKQVTGLFLLLSMCSGSHGKDHSFGPHMVRELYLLKSLSL